MLAVTCLGTIGFMYLEGLTFFNAVYFTVATMTTVGFGDITPLTAGGKILSMVIMIVGVGIALYFASTIVAVAIEGDLADIFGRRKMYKKLEALSNHIIICGAGRVGYQVIDRLQKEDVQFVVIEQDEAIVEGLRDQGILAMAGDATQDSLLVSVGIGRARGLISALPEDAQNVFVTLTSKGLNPDLPVVARMDRMDSESKLRRAGADKVISPAILGGRRMAISILKPASVDYVETLMHDKEEIEIEEIKISVASKLVNKSLSDSGIKEKRPELLFWPL